MCTGRRFQVDGVETEEAREEKLIMIPDCLIRRFVLREHKDMDGSLEDSGKLILRGREVAQYDVFSR